MKKSKYFISIDMSKNTDIYTYIYIYIYIYMQLVEFTFKHIVSKINTIWKKSFSQKELSKHASQPFHCLFWKKREYKVENIMTPIYIITNSKNTHTHTPTHPITTSRLYKQRKIKLKFKDNQKIT